MSINGRKVSVRRGPTLRTGYRPSVRVRPSPSSSSSDSFDDEERIGLTETPFDSQEGLDQNSSKRLSEKFETDETGKPIYHHGEETFGDIITHPIEELHAHKARKETFQSRVGRWSLLNKNKGASSKPVDPVPEKPIEYTIVLHFRQLRGNQEFGLSHDASVDFCDRLNFTQEERLRFNGVHDTDGLTHFLYKIKKDFSIKIHHKLEYVRNSTPAGQQQTSSEHHRVEIPHHDLVHHNSEHHTIEFNDNLYIEFKPKHNHHVELPVEARRRPFFKHPEPDLSADIGVETPASWLELFYDLFFVASITVFTHAHHITNWALLGEYTQWFIVTWWSWCASTLYTSRFDTDDVVHHIYKFFEMCGLIAMSGSSNHFLNSSAYVYGYITLKVVLVIEYFVVFVVAVLAKSKSRIPLAFYIGANLLSIALWASSITILQKDTHRTLRYLGVLCEILVNIIVRGDKSLSWAAGHLVERLGLLSLIILGENLMGLIGQVSGSGNAILIAIPNFMAVLCVFGFFFMYFEDFNKEVFLVNKYHQIWVYLHFPLHLCQVAFGIALIDILKFNKLQLIQEGRIVDYDAPESNEPNEASEAASGIMHGNSTSSDTTSESSSTTNEPAHKRAKRAIKMINKEYSSSQDDYNPMKTANRMRESYLVTSDKQRKATNEQVQWSALGQYFITTVMTASAVLSGRDAHKEITSNSFSHHLERREYEGQSYADQMSNYELVFVYKTFLIFGGLILVINSIIKALNTKLADIYGRIIIGSRLINAVVLWSMCALPFAKLDAIVLLCTMVGSLLFQAMIDLLD